MSDFNLSVPFFSQRDNAYEWHYRYEETDKDKNEEKGKVATPLISEKIADDCCNITCLCIVVFRRGGISRGISFELPFADCMKACSFLCRA